MKAVVTDPKVMSVLEKRKGQKGYREIQGDVFRELLLSLISTQVRSQRIQNSAARLVTRGQFHSAA